MLLAASASCPTYSPYLPLFSTDWLGLYGHLCPIFNIQFSIGLSTEVRRKLWDPSGHCGVPPLCRPSRDRWPWFRFVNPIYGAFARNPDSGSYELSAMAWNCAMV